MQPITFLTQLYYSDMTKAATIMTDLAEDLAAAGMTIKGISDQPTYLVDEGMVCYGSPARPQYPRS